jgi:cold shock protein
VADSRGVPGIRRQQEGNPALSYSLSVLRVVVQSSEETGMPTGTIARLLIDKGFGFIRDEAGVEHFFHRSAVRGAVFELLREGQRVEFSIEDSQKGPRAGDVRLIEG